jgi:hypothetical protein
MKTLSLGLALYACLLVSAMAENAGSPNTASPSNQSAPKLSTNNNPLTPEEWQKFRVARQAALKANPELLTKSAQLTMEMRAFQDKLNAAIIEADPKVAPIVAKLDNRHSESKKPVLPSK